MQRFWALTRYIPGMVRRCDRIVTGTADFRSFQAFACSKSCAICQQLLFSSIIRIILLMFHFKPIYNSALIAHLLCVIILYVSFIMCLGVAFVELKNIPVSMICVYEPDGNVKPLRFRYECEDHTRITIQIREIVDVKEVQYVGIEAFVYVCKAELDGAELLFELKYTIHTHQWVLFRLHY